MWEPPSTEQIPGQSNSLHPHWPLVQVLSTEFSHFNWTDHLKCTWYKRNIILDGEVITIFYTALSMIPLVDITSLCVSRSTDQQQHTHFVECRQIQSLGRNTLASLVIGEQQTALHSANPLKSKHVCIALHKKIIFFYHQSVPSAIERKTKLLMNCLICALNSWFVCMN